MILTRAPLRIPLGGGGTDFTDYYTKYGGYILSFAIQKYVYVAINPTTDDKIRVKYSKNETVDNPDQLINKVAAEALKSVGITKRIEVATFTDVPVAGGLGSSSAFCVALLAGLYALQGKEVSKEDLFLQAYDVERIKANLPGGIQDQFFATFGGAWSLELTSEVDSKPVEINGLLDKLHLLFTGIYRVDPTVASKQYVDIVRGDEHVLRSLHEVKEIGHKVYDCIVSNNLDEIGFLFHRHWVSKKTRSSSITTFEIDNLYNRALKAGATGGKLIGAGGGGHLLFYSPNGLNGFRTLPLALDTEGVKVIYVS